MLKYNIDIPIDVDSIMDEDFYIIDNVKAPLLRHLSQPIKFGAFASMFIKEGWCDVEINLKVQHLEAPCVLNIKVDQIVQIKQISDDLDVACLVLSRPLLESVKMVLLASGTNVLEQAAHTLQLDTEGRNTLQNIYNYVQSINKNKKHPYSRQALMHAVVSYFYHFATILDDKERNTTHSHGRISDTFLSLVQQHFMRERFLEFYADKMSITTKHLSRTVKQQTGLTAVEWIERFVILEAKAMLKSSTLTIQQIADHLNFPSQSFFGKYFKKNTGISPKDYRNSH